MAAASGLPTSSRLPTPQWQRASCPLHWALHCTVLRSKSHLCTGKRAVSLQVTSVGSDQRQFYSLNPKHQLARAPKRKHKHNSLNNKLLFKYLRISLVLADILNMFISPSYGLEKIIPLLKKLLVKGKSTVIYTGMTLSLNLFCNCGPKAVLACSVSRHSIYSWGNCLQGLHERKDDSGLSHCSENRGRNLWVSCSSKLLVGNGLWDDVVLPAPLCLSVVFKRGIQRLHCWNLFVFICFAVCISHIC